MALIGSRWEGRLAPPGLPPPPHPIPIMPSSLDNTRRGGSRIHDTNPLHAFTKVIHEQKCLQREKAGYFINGKVTLATMYINFRRTVSVTVYIVARYGKRSGFHSLPVSTLCNFLKSCLSRLLSDESKQSTRVGTLRPKCNLVTHRLSSTDDLALY